MAIPSGYSLLGRIGYNDRGVYSENNEYVRGDVVYHEGSSYVALTTVTGIAPTDDNTNWKYLAHGFGATELSEIDATDTSGFVGDAGTKVKGQTLIDKIAEYVMSKVVATDAFQTYLQKFLVDNCVTERSDLSLSAAQGKALQDQLATLNSNLNKLTEQSTDLANKIGKVKIIQGTKTINLGSNATSKIGLFTTKEIMNLFGVPILYKNNLTTLVMNGDFAASNFYVTGCYIENDILHAILNVALNYSIRLNYVFFYYG